MVAAIWRLLRAVSSLAVGDNLGQIFPDQTDGLKAWPSQIGWAMMLVRASTAWVMASMAVVTVNPGGRVMVKRGSRMAIFGTIRGSTIEDLASGLLALDDRYVGHFTSRSRGRGNDDMGSLGFLEAVPGRYDHWHLPPFFRVTQTALPVSMTLPPPTLTIQSALSSRAIATAASTMSRSVSWAIRRRHPRRIQPGHPGPV